MIFGLTIEKLLLIGLVAALILGPERLPRYAEALAGLTNRARAWVTTARTRVREEMGEDFDDVDWRKLDPRQYDPRRIIREALTEVDPFAEPAPAKPVVARATVNENSAYLQHKRKREALGVGEAAPFDSEAT